MKIVVPATPLVVASGESLIELLQQEYLGLKNHEGQGFICLAAAKKVLTPDRILIWAQEHPLYHALEDGRDDHMLVSRIQAGSTLLFAVLVLSKLEYLTFQLLSKGFSDSTLFDHQSFEECCRSTKLSAREKHQLVQNRALVGVVLEHDRHQDVPKDSVLPYLKREDPDEHGSYGVVYRLKVATGHLKRYNKLSDNCPAGNKSADQNPIIVAKKRTRATNDRSHGE